MRNLVDTRTSQGSSLLTESLKFLQPIKKTLSSLSPLIWMDEWRFPGLKSEFSTAVQGRFLDHCMFKCLLHINFAVAHH